MTTTATYVSIVKANHTIDLPKSIPVGAKVAVTLLPAEETEAERARNLRFQKVMDAIRAAIHSNYATPEISDRDLDQLIREARQAAKG
ncbi:MAG: hypothetical protein R3C14_16790 [Caldilineaceae bacterium]